MRCRTGTLAQEAGDQSRGDSMTFMGPLRSPEPLSSSGGVALRVSTPVSTKRQHSPVCSHPGREKIPRSLWVLDHKPSPVGVGLRLFIAGAQPTTVPAWSKLTSAVPKAPRLGPTRTATAQSWS